MFADGETFPAERMIRDYLLTHGDHIEAMRLLAKIGMKLDVLDDAELLLESVLVLAPDYHAARYDYALVAAATAQARAGPRRSSTSCSKIDPDNRAYRITHATACIGVGDHEQAMRIYRALLAGDAAGGRGRAAPVDRARPQDARQAAGGDRVLSQPPLHADRASAMRTGVSPISRPIDFAEAELERMRAAESSAPDAARRPLPSVLCARQGARGSRASTPNRFATTRPATR